MLCLLNSTVLHIRRPWTFNWPPWELEPSAIVCVVLTRHSAMRKSCWFCPVWAVAHTYSKSCTNSCRRSWKCNNAAGYAISDCQYSVRYVLCNNLIIHMKSYINNPARRFIPTVVPNTCTEIRVVCQKYQCNGSVKFITDNFTQYVRVMAFSDAFCCRMPNMLPLYPSCNIAGLTF